nr:hypothetical protein [Candidatus Sigynarchaeota archaeon]
MDDELKKAIQSGASLSKVPDDERKKQEEERKKRIEEAKKLAEKLAKEHPEG